MARPIYYLVSYTTKGKHFPYQQFNVKHLHYFIRQIANGQVSEFTIHKPALKTKNNG